MNFAKFLRVSYSQKTSEKLLLKLAHDFNEITILFKSYPLVKSIIVVAVAIFT